MLVPDGLDGVVLACRHLLEGGGVDDVVDARARAAQPGLVAHVADEESQLGVVVGAGLLAERDKFVAHDELLVLVARVDDDLLGVVVLEHVAGERVPERPGSSGDEYCLVC